MAFGDIAAELAARQQKKQELDSYRREAGSNIGQAGQALQSTLENIQKARETQAKEAALQRQKEQAQAAAMLQVESKRHQADVAAQGVEENEEWQRQRFFDDAEAWANDQGVVLNDDTIHQYAEATGQEVPRERTREERDYREAMVISTTALKKFREKYPNSTITDEEFQASAFGLLEELDKKAKAEQKFEKEMELKSSEIALKDMDLQKKNEEINNMIGERKEKRAKRLQELSEQRTVKQGKKTKILASQWQEQKALTRAALVQRWVKDGASLGAIFKDPAIQEFLKTPEGKDMQRTIEFEFLNLGKKLLEKTGNHELAQRFHDREQLNPDEQKLISRLFAERLLDSAKQTLNNPEQELDAEPETKIDSMLGALKKAVDYEPPKVATKPLPKNLPPLKSDASKEWWDISRRIRSYDQISGIDNAMWGTIKSGKSLNALNNVFGWEGKMWSEFRGWGLKIKRAKGEAEAQAIKERATAWLSVKLNELSGAAVSDQELHRAMTAYLDPGGDWTEVVRQLERLAQDELYGLELQIDAFAGAPGVTPAHVNALENQLYKRSPNAVKRAERKATTGVAGMHNKLGTKPK